MRIGVVAGEASGDYLGAAFLEALRERVPDALVEGIGGPRMIERGCQGLFPMERLSVMGLAEVAGRYPELRRIQSRLVQHFTQHPPDVFVGIDAPDFNLTLERRLKAAGVRTAHYVSPSVWAWRRYRVKKIKAAVDHMFVLYPFETAIYESCRIPVTYAGHPLADEIPLEVDQQAARTRLGLPAHGEIVALLPGSRVNEVRQLAGDFLRAAQWCLEQRPGLQFVVPLANADVDEAFKEIYAAAGAVPALHQIQGQAREVMAAADVVLAAGGTATLEAMLLKRPVVMAYRVAPLTYRLARHLVHTRTYSLPNLLAGRALIPEYIQHQVTGEALGEAVLAYLQQPHMSSALQAEFTRLHDQLRRQASSRVAAGVMRLAGQA